MEQREITSIIPPGKYIPFECKNEACKWVFRWTELDVAGMIQQGLGFHCPKCHQVHDMSSYPIPDGYEWTESQKILYEAEKAKTIRRS